jgi:hypothetical protein
VSESACVSQLSVPNIYMLSTPRVCVCVCVCARARCMRARVRACVRASTGMLQDKLLKHRARPAVRARVLVSGRLEE